ncbi:nitrogenase-stabilizing/protective protein NifW [Vibrio sp. SCSIO 43137]|uniref:nitrogenase-stabilizing/protective protein NifW n=1 Tax=Vibrio sp. SCSIO 43137 TaxID=3021011 RepID=UPI0023075F60|nr:nitrogenase-stabilizing/protective protein NifW [Vibrio sp. SCSIO 43137]WCE32389.1 nitrogenase-stabilizing/protective protein NifW [Vibrio sp. SCSIO 43137]
MSQTDILQKIASFTSIEQALEYFEIDFDSKFIDEYRQPLTKRFNGYLIMQKPDDWFSARRALKNAYCKIQRGRLDPHSRSACCGCTSCQRR